MAGGTKTDREVRIVWILRLKLGKRIL